MRLSFAFTMILGIFIMACNENNSQANIQSVVLNTFNLEFKQVEDVNWVKMGDNYEVEFEIDDVEHTALISAAGKLIKYKKEISGSNLPEPVKSKIREFAAPKIGDLDLLVVGTEQYYQVELDGRLTDSYIIFNEMGEEIEDVIYFD